MSLAVNFANLVGDWKGENRLWLMPEDPVHESETSLTVRQAVRGGFTDLHYTWADNGEAQEGILVIGPLTDTSAVQAEWIDTFHTAGSFMSFTGTVGADGTLTLHASYPAPEGPDWGWQIRIAPPSGNQFKLRMYNIIPEEGETLAVEAAYTRA